MTKKKHFENCGRTDGRTEGRTNGRTTDATPWHKLIGPFGPDELKMPEILCQICWQLITCKHLRTSLLQLVIYMFLTRVMKSQVFPLICFHFKALQYSLSMIRNAYGTNKMLELIFKVHLQYFCFCFQFFAQVRVTCTLYTGTVYVPNSVVNIYKVGGKFSLRHASLKFCNF